MGVEHILTDSRLYTCSHLRIQAFQEYIQCLECLSLISEKRVNINIRGREYRDYSSNIPSHDYEMVFSNNSKYVASYYVKIDIFNLPSSALMIEKL